MASDGSSTQQCRKKKKKNSSSKKVDEAPEVLEIQADIEGLTASGNSALLRGDCTEALGFFKKAFKASLELQETRVQRACAFNVGAAYVEAGKPQKGLDFLKRAQPGERGERVADLQFNLGAAHEALKEPAHAAAHYLQAAQLYRSQGEGGSEGDACMKLARCHLLAQDWTQAAQSLQRAGESYRVAGKLESAAVALKEAGDHMLQSDDFTEDDVIAVLTECLELTVSVKDEDTAGKLYNDLGLSFSQLQLFPEAAECFERALPLARTEPQRRAVVLQNLGAIHNTLAQYQQALGYHREAAALHGSQGSRGAQGQCFSNLAFALSQLGEHEEAGENYLHALQAFKDTDDHEGQWQACEGLGSAKLRVGDPEKATVYYKQALGLLCKCKDFPSVAQERLVNRLSDALQYKLSLQSRLSHGKAPAAALPHRRLYESKPFFRRVPQDRHAPQGVAGINGARPSVLPRTLQRLDFNHQPGAELSNGLKEKGGSQGGVALAPEQGAEQRSAASQKKDGDSDNAAEVMTESDSQFRDPHSEQPNYQTALPEANRNLNNTYLQPEPHYQNQALSETLGLSPHTEHLYETIKQRTTVISDPPLAQSSELSLTERTGSEEATPLYRKWRSRVCAVM
ncbi:tetratricopeptide repeat protein 24 [Anguilla anguilla]|uniref:tetratricopeptide repeat protein 24 n=1 Tax=Anguilla anguilla TaxID=7936 RepID=UPI0015B27EDD|nr:tetratricopeptide repeat protein 24 [Anguilla anguilla]XP_035235211.1 tetratricopeptide repeat protein 24 [Anguilla anguilla]